MIRAEALTDACSAFSSCFCRWTQRFPGLVPRTAILVLHSIWLMFSRFGILCKLASQCCSLCSTAEPGPSCFGAVSKLELRWNVQKINPPIVHVSTDPKTRTPILRTRGDSRKVFPARAVNEGRRSPQVMLGPGRLRFGVWGLRFRVETRLEFRASNSCPQLLPSDQARGYQTHTPVLDANVVLQLKTAPLPIEAE